MAASPEFFQPAYSPGLHLFATTQPAAAAEEDDYYRCRTPTGADLGNPAICPPAPRKPRPPPACACRKRLFAAADIIALRFDDLEAIFRPASLSDAAKQQQHRRPSRGKLSRSTDSRRSVGKILG